MGYVLESEQEARRLYEQEKIPAYSLDSEFGDLDISSSDYVLDAGCGHGMLSRFIRHNYGSQVVGCDISDIRIMQAKKRGSDVDYLNASIESMPFDDDTFDVVCSRYVFEYLPNPLKAASEIYRVLKPSGRSYISDLDGVFSGLKTSDPKFNEELCYLCDRLPVDVNVGRSLRAYFEHLPFKSVKENKINYVFTGDDLLSEKENNVQRFIQAKTHMINILGEGGYDTFFEKYIYYMGHKDSVYSFDKYIISMVK